MNNKVKTGETNTEIVERAPNGQFLQGVSGNPNGRPRKTEEQKETLEEIKALAPRAVQVLAKILSDNSKASWYAKLQAISIILDRTYGRPETALKLETPQQSVEESSERIRAVVESIRIKRGIK